MKRHSPGLRIVLEALAPPEGAHRKALLKLLDRLEEGPADDLLEQVILTEIADRAGEQIARSDRARSMAQALRVTAEDRREEILDAYRRMRYRVSGREDARRIGEALGIPPESVRRIIRKAKKNNTL